MIVLDTSALVRFFTGDDGTKAKKVKNLFESGEKLLLIDAVVMELIYTLKKVYKLNKDDILRVVEYLTSLSQVVVNRQTREALEIYRENNLSITDCLVVIYGKGCKVASFDNNILKRKGIKPAL